MRLTSRTTSPFPLRSKGSTTDVGHHRENIIEAVIDIVDELDLYVGEPTADIDLLTHDEFDVFE